MVRIPCYSECHDDDGPLWPFSTQLLSIQSSFFPSTLLSRDGNLFLDHLDIRITQIMIDNTFCLGIMEIDNGL